LRENQVLESAEVQGIQRQPGGGLDRRDLRIQPSAFSFGFPWTSGRSRECGLSRQLLRGWNEICQARAIPKHRARTILVLGGDHRPRKNQERLIQAYRLVKNQFGSFGDGRPVWLVDGEFSDCFW
jgi:hypothetical protein